MARFVQWYGGTPLHLLALVAGAALAAYAVTRVSSQDALVAIGAWFALTLVLHDLVLFPTYAAADRTAAWLGRRLGTAEALRVPPVNHIRVPAVLSGLLLLAWFPLVLRLSSSYQSITGRSDGGYLGRWLLVTGVLFAGSMLIYAVRLLRAERGGG